MSEDEDIDIESDTTVDLLERKTVPQLQSGSQLLQYTLEAEKRAHHNALERKRRDHIKDSFSSLRDSVPALQGEKVVSDPPYTVSAHLMKASRAQILKKAAEYIQFMRRKNSAHQQDIDDLKRQNALLESQIRTLEKAKATGNFAVESSEVSLVNMKSESASSFPPESESDTSDSEAAATTRRSKKLKISGLGSL